MDEIPSIYSAFNVYCRKLAPGTVSLTGDRAQGNDSKHCAYSSNHLLCTFSIFHLYRLVVIFCFDFLFIFQPNIHVNHVASMRFWYLSHMNKYLK